MTREEAIRWLEQIWHYDLDADIHHDIDKRYEAIDMAIEALQTEVVRCKDCRWWSGSVNTSHNNHLCKRAQNQNIDYWTSGDDYCSYGERKERNE